MSADDSERVLRLGDANIHIMDKYGIAKIHLVPNTRRIWRKPDAEQLEAHAGIHTVDIAGVELGDGVLRVLCGLKNLRVLSLIEVSVPESEWQSLDECFLLTSLSYSGPKLTSTAVDSFSKLRQLQLLQIDSECIAPSQVEKLKNILSDTALEIVEFRNE
ncbi:MAG: hypothetical protein SFV23_16805 [Planctomycetaceae bacterium]|nr:hypothetical protein [Planctomycetaceae bacterium]